MFRKAIKQQKLKRTIRQTNIDVHNEVNKKCMEDRHNLSVLRLTGEAFRKKFK